MTFHPSQSKPNQLESLEWGIKLKTNINTKNECFLPQFIASLIHQVSDSSRISAFHILRWKIKSINQLQVTHIVLINHAF